MKMKLLLPLAFLFGCSVLSTTKFSGESATDNNLRSDILKLIKINSEANHNCGSISEVHSEIKNIKKTDNPRQPLIVDELWIISACGKSLYYPIRMSSNEKGSTDFQVEFGKNIQIRK